MGLGEPCTSIIPGKPSKKIFKTIDLFHSLSHPHQQLLGDTEMTEWRNQIDQSVDERPRFHHQTLIKRDWRLGLMLMMNMPTPKKIAGSGGISSQTCSSLLSLPILKQS